MKALDLIKPSSSHAQKVATYFSKAAIHYEKTAHLQQAIAHELIGKISSAIKPATILDLGCSTAYFTPILQSQFPEATLFSLDVSLNMLKQAKKVSNLVCANMENLPFAKQSIELIFASMSLQWSSDLMSNFVELKHALKPNGRCLLSLPGPLTLSELKQSWAAVDDYTHVNNFPNVFTIQKTLQHIGFKEVSLSRKSYELEYPSVLALTQYLKKTGATYVVQKRNSLTGKNKFKQMCAHYEKFRKANGLLPCTYDIIFVEAQL